MGLGVTIGEAQIITLSDATGIAVDLASPFPDGPLSAVPAARQGLGTYGKLRPNLGGFLLKPAGKATLIDLSVGPGPVAYLSGLSGRHVARF